MTSREKVFLGEVGRMVRGKARTGGESTEHYFPLLILSLAKQSANRVVTTLKKHGIMPDRLELKIWRGPKYSDVIGWDRVYLRIVYDRPVFPLNLTGDFLIEERTVSQFLDLLEECHYYAIAFSFEEEGISRSSKLKIIGRNLQLVQPID